MPDKYPYTDSQSLRVVRRCGDHEALTGWKQSKPKLGRTLQVNFEHKKIDIGLQSATYYIGIGIWMWAV